MFFLLVEGTISDPWKSIFCSFLFFLQALDVLTQELTAHLDEDMQELLELEKEKVSFDLWIMFDSQLWGSLRLNAFHELRTWVWKLVDLLIHRIWTLLAVWPESYERVDLWFAQSYRRYHWCVDWFSRKYAWLSVRCVVSQSDNQWNRRTASSQVTHSFIP